MVEEEAVIEATREFARLWTAGDAQAMAACFTEDAVRVSVFGDVQRGRREIADALERMLKHEVPGSWVEQERGWIRMISPEMAIWQGTMDIVLPPPLPRMKGHVVQVMKRVGGKWLIQEAHPKSFPPRPGRMG